MEKAIPPDEPHSEPDVELPKYSARPSLGSQGSVERSEHVYSLENSKGHKWVSLSVKSRSANPNAPPLFLEGDIITGRVDLDLDKPENIKAVMISVSKYIDFFGKMNDYL